MEILHFHFNLIPILLVFFILFLLVRKWKEMNQRLLPPGPWKLPLIGSLHHLIGALPHHAPTKQAQKYGQLMHLQLGEVDAVVSSPHLAKEILKVHDLSFAARPKLVASDIVFYRQKDIAFAEYGDYWKQMRKICTSELLSSKIVKTFSLIRQDEVHNLVASISSTPNVVVNMSEKVLQLTSSVICRSAFGKVWDDRDNLLMIMRELLALLAGFDVVDLFPSWKLLHKISGKRNRLMNMHHKLDVILENIINDHRQSKANGGKGNNKFEGENLIDVLLRVMENDKLQFPMTNDNIKAVILDIFFGGTETSATTIQWAFSELMKNPNVMAKVQEEVRMTFDRKKVYDDNILEELKYLKLVIKETLRLHPPGPLLPARECREETTIEGCTISLKTKLIVNCWAMGRDPERSRMCPGMHFGLANVVYPLAQLLYHFDWQLPYGQQPEDLDMTETLGLSATRKHDLRLIAIPHDLSQKWKEMNQRLLPPDPWKLPLIGSLHHLIGALPHHAPTKQAQKYGPLMHLQLGEVDAVVVSSPHLAKEILKVHDLSFAARPKLVASDIVFYRQKDIAFAEYGDYWKQMRKLCISELLSAKMVKSFSLIRQDEVHNLVTSIRSTPDDVVNMSEKALQLTSSVICRSAFGKVWDDRDNLLMIMREVLDLLAGFDVVDLFPSWKLLHQISGKRNRLMNMHHKLDVILENNINDHKQNKANGVKGNNEFEGEDLIDDIFFGGTETSATTIQWALSELMKNPNIMTKAQGEARCACKGKKDLDDSDLEKLKYLKLVVKETLRLHPPVPLLIPRECREETTIGGYTIPLKTKVIVNCWAMTRDPESWDDPENFVPERFENSSVDFKGNHYQFIPFGAGSRICPGMQYSLAGVMYPLAQLLYHFDWKLPNGKQPEDLDMTETFGITANRKKSSLDCHST
ncbi:hypothetical protein H5410_043011 [Solanum commersonii]|uniref:Cytochrome P450 n=1 Tax=Solanum commersonii TaxID=4109 RepID=A0A9J5XWC6_SOLCO|nr:hypothetical protein H5410_043011 [Solanum commersonii]